MTSLDPHLPPAAGIQIDASFLLRQIPSLVQVRRKHRTWNDYGQKLIRDLQIPAVTVRRMAGMQISEEATEWSYAKQLIHGVLATPHREYAAIRKRLGDLHTNSTPKLLSTLGLWLAGMPKCPSLSPSRWSQ
ncbi:MAG: hypothetical protein V4689_06995 [Verrucomicrobiota bacterium]